MDEEIKTYFENLVEQKNMELQVLTDIINGMIAKQKESNQQISNLLQTAKHSRTA
jgi:ribosomal protein L13